MPDEGSVIKLENHNHSVGVNFVVYVEFDSSTKSMSNCELSSDKNFTNQYQKQKPGGISYHIVFFDSKLYSQAPVIYRVKSKDEDVGQIFVEMLEEKIKKIYKEFDFAKKMNFTDEERCEFNDATHSWICT